MGSGSSPANCSKLAISITSDSSSAFDVLATISGLAFGRGFQIDCHAATRIATSNGLLQFNFRVVQILRSNRAEDVGCHHAQRRPVEHLVAERACAVAQN